jgi:hypothetical protein
MRTTSQESKRKPSELEAQIYSPDNNFQKRTDDDRAEEEKEKDEKETKENDTFAML